MAGSDTVPDPVMGKTMPEEPSPSALRSAAWMTEVKLHLSDKPCQNGKSSASKGGLGTLRFFLQSLMETDIQRMLSIRPQRNRNGDDPEKQSSDSISLF